jgi:regulator of nonsense transcripts 2
MTVTETAEHDGESEKNGGGSVSEDDKNILTSYIQEVEERFHSKQELRSANQNAVNTRPSESYFSKLDSSLKKNTAFVKKIKNFSATQLETYLKDMSGLNLSKYISEIAAAIVDAKLKMTDVAAAVKMCSILHQTYADFSQHLFENWQKTLSFKVGEKIPNPSKLRVDLRFYAELVQASVFNNKNAFTLLGNVITTLVNMDKDEHYNCSIILSFCKHCGEDYAGLVPRKMKELSEKLEKSIPKSTFLPPEKQQNVRTLLRDYYMSLSKHLVKDHQEIQNFEKQNMRILQTKGELSQERKDKLESLHSAYDKLLTSTQSFAEILDEDMPTLKNQTVMKNDESMIVTGAGPDLDESALANIENVWCDIETQRFYCELPELQAFLPTSFINKQSPPPADSVTEEVLDSEIPTEELEDDEQIEEVAAVPEDEPEDATTTNASNKIVLEAFLNSLPNCVNREMIDNAAIDFLVTLNNKHNRKKTSPRALRRQPNASRPAPFLRPLRRHPTPRSPRSGQRTVSNASARLQIPRPKEGPDQHRIKNKSRAIHRRTGQVRALLQDRSALLSQSVTLRLLAPPHRDGVQFVGGLRQVLVLQSRFASTDESLLGADDEEKGRHGAGLALRHAN